MKIEQGTFCPLIQGPCKKLECAWFTRVAGTNPNTGEQVEEWNCAVTLMPMLQIEISQKVRGTQSATESFRNEVVKANKENQQLYIQQSIANAKKIAPLNQPINTNTNILGY